MFRKVYFIQSVHCIQWKNLYCEFIFAKSACKTCALKLEVSLIKEKRRMFSSSRSLSRVMWQTLSFKKDVQTITSSFKMHYRTLESWATELWDIWTNFVKYRISFSPVDRSIIYYFYRTWRFARCPRHPRTKKLFVFFKK